MPKGLSGRVVLEIDPALKRELYAALSREGLTLKSWFVERANVYLQEHIQPSLQFVREPAPPRYASKRARE